MFDFETTLDGQPAKLRVDFTHYNPQDPKTSAIREFGTYCYIIDTDGDQTIAMGLTELHPLDWTRYNRNTGRKLSLSRALDMLCKEHSIDNFPDEKSFRTQVWKKYFETRGRY